MCACCASKLVLAGAHSSESTYFSMDSVQQAILCMIGMSHHMHIKALIMTSDLFISSKVTIYLFILLAEKNLEIYLSQNW